MVLKEVHNVVLTRSDSQQWLRKSKPREARQLASQEMSERTIFPRRL
jgi:putative SOS response-associated peptidase YedK